jgi:hypothetical protein
VSEQKTPSEMQFESFCESHGLRWERISPQSDEGLRTPDYYIYPMAEQVAVEVKQLEPNPEERKQIQIRQQGGVSVFGCTPGARVRSVIDTAGRQLRARAKEQIPAMIVLFNTEPYLRHHTESYAVRVGMYGLDTIVLGVPSDPSKPSRLVDRRFGPKQKMTKSDNNSISAIAVFENNDLCVYHNIHAEIPLRPQLLHGRASRQFTLERKRDGAFQQWIEIPS